MRLRFAAVVLLLAAPAVCQEAKTSATMKSVVLQQLRETHNQKAWFVSEKEAVAGLTPEQAAWSDGKNHSVGQLVQHLVYWNTQSLNRLKGGSPKATDNNDETFTFKAQDWTTAVKQFDEVMNGIEQFVQSADDATVAKLAPMLSRIAAHNAYHIGEIVMVRKAQGAWNPENGVK